MLLFLSLTPHLPPHTHRSLLGVFLLSCSAPDCLCVCMCLSLPVANFSFSVCLAAVSIPLVSVCFCLRFVFFLTSLSKPLGSSPSPLATGCCLSRLFPPLRMPSFLPLCNLANSFSSFKTYLRGHRSPLEALFDAPGTCRGCHSGSQAGEILG